MGRIGGSSERLPLASEGVGSPQAMPGGVTSPAPSGCAPGLPLERTRAWWGHKGRPGFFGQNGHLIPEAFPPLQGPPRVPSRTAMSLGCFRDASDSSTSPGGRGTGRAWRVTEGRRSWI